MGRGRVNRRSAWLTVANIVSFLRLLLTLPVVYALLQEGSAWRWTALLLFLLAAGSDGLDGYLARSRGQVTRLGQLLDPVCDKVLGVAVFGGLVYRGLLPGWMFWTLILKEALLLVGGAVLLGRGQKVSSGSPLGKVATVVRFSGFVLVLIGNDLGGWMTGAGVTLSSGRRRRLRCSE